MKKAIIFVLICCMLLLTACTGNIKSKETTARNDVSFNYDIETEGTAEESISFMQGEETTEELTVNITDTTEEASSVTATTTTATTTAATTAATHDYSSIVGEYLDSSVTETDYSNYYHILHVVSANDNEIVFDIDEEYLDKSAVASHWALTVSMVNIRATKTSGTTYSFSGTYSSDEGDPGNYGRADSRRVSGTVSISGNTVYVTFSEVKNISNGNYNDTNIPIGRTIAFNKR